MENLWYVLQRKLDHYLKRNQIKNEEELFEVLKKLSNEISVNEVNDLINSVKKRVKEVERKKGMATNY